MQAQFRFDDLRVEELESRLEFTAPADGWCNLPACDYYYIQGPDGIYDEFPCIPAEQ